MLMKKSNKNVYILSLEASDIYSHVIRGSKIKDDFSGMIPVSLELTKSKLEKLQVVTSKINGKETTRDIINVKFKFKVQNNYFIRRKTIKKIKKIEKENKIKTDELNYKISIIGQREKTKEDIRKLEDITKEFKRVYKSEDYVSRLKEFIEYLKEEKAKKDMEIVYTDTVIKIKEIKVKERIIKIKKINFRKWDSVGNEALRRYLYNNGFTIRTVNEKTGEITEDKYVVYGRSSSKSRTGQCLFIKESLVKNMVNWKRMGLPFLEGMKCDYAGLLAYESLVGSNLESTIKINTKNILIIDDVESEFPWKCNVISLNEDNVLDSVEHDNWMVKNSLFDGESLLDKSLWKNDNDYSMKLLRQHMFKSASFNCNIQQYLKDNCPEGVKFDKWKINNMFGQPMLAKNVLMICTPTSLKALKFDKDLEKTPLEIWEHWKKTVEDEGCNFGIVKHEKGSKRGLDDLGNILQQSSYQMVNSLPASFGDIDELTKFEREYIDKLKNNDEFFIQYLKDNASDINSNLMYATLAEHNSDFVNVLAFRNYRKAEINKYVSHCKLGKIKLLGDYCVLLGNPMQYLLHAIGKLTDENNKILDTVEFDLKDNEIYTTLFPVGFEYVSFRNPHTAPSNVLVAKNTYVEDIDKYFNLSKNIVCVNAHLFPLQDILSSCDYDSDSMVIFNDPKILELGKLCYGKYNVCVNNVASQKRKYKLTTKDMCIIDNQLASSQRNIGNVVNLGQLCMSTYWDLKSKLSINRKKELIDLNIMNDMFIFLYDLSLERQMKNLMVKIDVVTVLSSICIDLAKKFYDLDIDKAIRDISKSKELRYLKPTFWNIINKPKPDKEEGNKKNIKPEDKVEDYNCPMDYLNTRLSKLPNANRKNNMELSTFLIPCKVAEGDRNQEDKIFDYARNMCYKLNGIHAEHNGTEDYEVEERNNLIDNQIKYYNFRMRKLTVKKSNMYSILNHMVKNNDTDIQTKLMNILFTRHKDIFLETFNVK